MAYLQQVTWIKEEPWELLDGELASTEDFDDVENTEKEPIEDMVTFFKEHGHEYSVYTVDFSAKEVVFVKTKEDVDLRPYCTVLQAQRENVEKVLTMPMSMLQDVADAVAEEVEHVQQIFLYMTGRCGSTLFMNAVHTMPSVQAINTPDVYCAIADAANWAKLEAADEDQDEEDLSDEYEVLRDDVTAVAFVKNITTLLNYYFLKSDPMKRTTIVYSLHPDTFHIGSLMGKAHPKAKTAFLYRNGLKFYESHLRLMLDNEMRHFRNFQKAMKTGRQNFEWENEYGSVVVFGDEPELETDQDDRNVSYYIITLWQGAMKKALELQEQEPERFFHAVLNYETLVEKKSKVFLEAMEKLGVKADIADADIEVPLAEVFNKEALTGPSGFPFSSHEVRETDEYQPHSDEWVGEFEQGIFDTVCKRTGWEPTAPDFVFPGCLC